MSYIIIKAMQSLPKLLEETDFQKMLSDEKMRSEQHKTNYQILKIEHSRLKNDNARLECDLKTALDDNKRLIEASKKGETYYKSEIADMKTQIQIAQAQHIEEEENLHTQLRTEIEQVYKEKYLQVQLEADKYREDFNKIRYDYTFIKSEYDHLQLDHSRNLAEKQLKYETEIANLHKKLQVIQLKSAADSSYDTEQLQKLRRENTHLHVKVKSLLSEINDLRAQEQHINSEKDEITKLRNKQIADCIENIKNLEAEKNSLLLTKETLKDELSSCRETVASLTAQLSSSQQEISRLKGIYEEAAHNSKLKETDLKMEIARRSSDSEREQNKMSLVIQELNIELEVIKGKCEQYKKKFLESELHVENEKRAIENEEFLKVSQLETEKSNLEVELTNLNRKLREKEEQLNSEKRRHEDTATKIREELQDIQSHNVSLREIESTCQELKESLEKEKSDNQLKKKQMTALVSEKNNMIEVQNELLEQRATLKDALERINNDLKKSQKKLEDINTNHAKEMYQLQSNLVSNENNYQKKIQNIENENLKASLDFTEQQRVIKNYSRLIIKLRKKLELLQAKNNELEVKQEVLSESVSKHEHELLKKKLKNLEKRHNEFRTVVEFGSQNMAATSHPFLSAVAAANQDSDFQQYGDIDLKTRLDAIEDQQKKEIEVLNDFKKSK
ncbi:Centrosomal protein [Nymphon striatum]|nr:Centrosomal protein [Nymphon striatum]